MELAGYLVNVVVLEHRPVATPAHLRPKMCRHFYGSGLVVAIAVLALRPQRHVLPQFWFIAGPLPHPTTWPNWACRLAVPGAAQTNPASSRPSQLRTSERRSS
jgi:hypothetical protein